MGGGGAVLLRTNKNPVLTNLILIVKYHRRVLQYSLIVSHKTYRNLLSYCMDSPAMSAEAHCPNTILSLPVSNEINLAEWRVAR